MKKYIILLFAMTLIVSCTQVTSTPSNGFGPRDFPITMGSQSSVDVVIAMDKLWKEGDFDGMREHIVILHDLSGRMEKYIAVRNS